MDIGLWGTSLCSTLSGFTELMRSIKPPHLVKDRGFLWVEFLYPQPYPPKPLPLAEGTGFPGVRGWVFAKWWGGGEHHCGRCNYQSPGYSLSKNIQYNVETKAKKKREDSIPQMWCNCGFIEKVRYEENIPVAFDQSIILPSTFAKKHLLYTYI